jgi:hypothetical protein
MRTISAANRFHLIPSNYKEVQGTELQKIVRNISIIELSEPILLEDIELEIAEWSSSTSQAQLMVHFFSKDINTPTGADWDCANRTITLSEHPHFVSSSSPVALEPWIVDNDEPLLIHRIGFSTINSTLSIVAVIRTLASVGDEDGFFG